MVSFFPCSICKYRQMRAVSRKLPLPANTIIGSSFIIASLLDKSPLGSREGYPHIHTHWVAFAAIPCTSSRFVAPAEVLGEKLFGCGVKLEPVFGFGEAVALVWEKQVLVIDPFALHSGNDLLGLCLLDARIVSPLRDQHGNLD